MAEGKVKKMEEIKEALKEIVRELRSERVKRVEWS